MVESTFGIMAARFRLLRTTIELNENNVKLCILAMCSLHNWLMTVDPSINDALNSEVSTSYTSAPESIEISNEATATAEAKNVREILKNYFITPSGEIPWQYDMA